MKFNKLNILFIVLISFSAYMYSCSTTKQFEEVQWFIVDSVYSDSIYTINIKDPDPEYRSSPMLFPSGGSAMIPEKYDRYIKIYYKNKEQVWDDGDTLILIKK